MHRNNYRRYSWLSFAALFLSAFCARSFAQGNLPYNTLSSNPGEVIITIRPDYKFSTVTDEKTGESYERVTFNGSSLKGLAVGSPATEWIPVDLLAPSGELAKIEIVKEEYEPARSAMLAPVPKWTFGSDEFKTPHEHYLGNPDLYSAPTPEVTSIGSASIYRTAYTQELRINPIRYDAAARTIKLVKDLTVKITFANIPSVNQNFRSSSSLQESELFQNLFANGNTYQFYHSAANIITKYLSSPSVSYKKSASIESQVGEKWLLVTTTDEGVYHITQSDLVKAGISNVIPATIQLFGYGGQALPEDLDSATGELHECALDIITNGDGSFVEARFYEPGTTEWHFDPNTGRDPLYGLFHILNPFTASGHFLLKTGGSPSSKRIVSTPENIASFVDQSTVPTIAVHEDEERFEDPAISREFVGEDIPNGRSVSITLPDLPGYTSDSTIMRPGFNSHDTGPHTFDLSLNGTALNQIIDGYAVPKLDDDHSELIPNSARNWETEILAGSLMHAQNNTLTLSATSAVQDAKFWLDWVEIFYRRQASLAIGQVPFYVLADSSRLRYNFTEAASGEAWDVTDPWNPVKKASAAGSSMSVPVQGKANGFRQFVAFTSASLKSPFVSATESLTLHDGVGETGAEDIIVTPAAFQDQANKLAKQRTMGGQATGPMSVAVVSVEDIYREFGYGSNDYTAIRNFLSYTLRHATAGNTTVPLFVTLFANGHCDYRNKTTQLPVGVPIYETWRNNSANNIRTGQPGYFPDDAFYVRLTPRSDRLDIAVGRVTVHTAGEADAFVSKVIKYETSSDQGDWRSRATFICDDRHYDDANGRHGVYDELVHIDDTFNEIEHVPVRILLHDIFGQAYTRVPTAAGIRMPEMENDIVDAFNSGAALISWVGHGNPAVWAHEAVLAVPATINKLTNFNRLAFVTTATCNFSTCDDYTKPVSGGVMLITKPDGGAIGSLGTSLSVSPDATAPTFYRVLFSIGCNDLAGSAPVGVAYIAARAAGGDGAFYYILGDPSQRLIFPRQYVTIDSINGIAFNESDAPRTIPALSQMTISGHISNDCHGSDVDANFNGNAAVTLFDAPTHVSVVSTFPANDPRHPGPITDNWDIDGPILYHGSSTVTGGRFRTTFIVSKDIKFDTSKAKISMLAYSDNFHSALGMTRNIVINGVDAARANSDHQGPVLVPYIGSRAFKSGDVVPVNSTIIVDVSDISGLNTSTASIGHSFIAWTDDSTSGAIDLASSYVSKQDDYTTGTSVEQAKLPVGKHILRVRAFDALDNPTFAEVEFIARDVQPYALYSTEVIPNPVRSHAVFTFLQPSAPESPVDVTISIYTVIGQKVRDLSAQSISQNSVSIPFDGRDDAGSPLADGIYIYRITAQERLTSNQTNVGGKFVIVRQ